MASYTDRYVAAAARALPQQNRDDLSSELEASIIDAVAARVDAGESPDAAERAVLMEMGDPTRLALDYADRPMMLIGPRYFLDWWRLLKLLLWIAPAGAALGVAIAQALAGATVGQAIGAVAATTVSVVVHVGFWTTLVFAILEWTQPKTDGPLNPWSLDQLPELRKPGVGLSEMVASLVFLALAAAAIVWDRFLGFVWIDGESLPVLNPALWPWWIVGLFAVMIAEGVLAVAVYRRGRWTPALATLNMLVALAVAIPAVWLLAEGMLVNPAFVEAVFPTAAPADITATVIAVSIGAIALWDIVDAWYKVYRDRPVR